MPGKKRILIAAADHDLITRLAFFFEDKGYETAIAWGGREAIEQLRSGGFDIVLLGEYLPDVNPKEILHAVRQLSNMPAVVLIEAAQADPEIAAMYSEVGGNCIVRGSSAYLIFEAAHECLTGENVRLRKANEPVARRA